VYSYGTVHFTCISISSLVGTRVCSIPRSRPQYRTHSFMLASVGRGPGLVRSSLPFSVARLEDSVFQINFNDDRLMSLFLNNRRRKRLMAKESCRRRDVYELDNTEFLRNSSKCLGQSNTY
jgi:hypothetical protein